MNPSKFKVGDRVRVVSCVQPKNQCLVGAIGTVDRTDTYWVWVKLPDGGVRNFTIQQIEIIAQMPTFDIKPVSSQSFVPLSPQSPQPQTTQQKEDTVKPYVVIHHNLGVQTQAVITGYYTTEAEAREAAEVSVAGFRSNLTQKQYFAVTIVNTKTGKLVGSVVDAPPAVDWAS